MPERICPVPMRRQLLGRRSQAAPRNSKKYVQGIPNDLCNRTVMGKNYIGHAGEILIEQRSKDVRIQRFHAQRREIATLFSDIAGPPIPKSGGKVLWRTGPDGFCQSSAGAAAVGHNSTFVRDLKKMFRFGTQNDFATLSATSEL